MRSRRATHDPPRATRRRRGEQAPGRHRPLPSRRQAISNPGQPDARGMDVARPGLLPLPQD
eukprot:1684588-Pyramimonas_sp.AAC.1